MVERSARAQALKLGVPLPGRTRPELAVVAFGIVVTVVACGGPRPSTSPRVTASPVLSPLPSDPAIAEATEIRTQYGLRADEAWVRSVARDPTALVPEEYGIPLLPAEFANLLSRNWPNGLIIQLRAYGAQYPDDFATAFINEAGSGAIVKFKQNVDRHRLAPSMLHLDGPVIVEQADWSLKDLNGSLTLVKRELPWIRATGAQWVDPVIYELENKVVIRFEGSPDLVPLIEAHFGSPGWLAARREGPAR